MHEPDSLEQLERALAMCDLRLEDARLVACTHAHSDHCGQAPVDHRGGRLRAVDAPQPRVPGRAWSQDPEALFARRLEVARQSGVPEEPLRRYAAERRPSGSGFAGPIQPDRDLLDGVTIADRPGRVDHL